MAADGSVVATDGQTALARDGRSTRWDPHRRERRLAIINAAVDAIEAFGPDALTAQIADRAGVPRTHVYRHFDGKPSLDLAVSAHIANQIGQRIRLALATPGTAREVIAASIDEHLAWIEAHPDLYRFLSRHAYAVRTTGAHDADDAKAAFAAELTTLVQRYLRAIDADPAPAERIIVGVVGLVDATAAWWLEKGGVPRHELTEELADRVWALLEYSWGRLGLRLDPEATLPNG